MTEEVVRVDEFLSFLDKRIAEQKEDEERLPDDLDVIVQQVDAKVERWIRRQQKPKKDLLNRVNKVGDMNWMVRLDMEKINGWWNKYRFIVDSQEKHMKEVLGEPVDCLDDPAGIGFVVNEWRH